MKVQKSLIKFPGYLETSKKEGILNLYKPLGITSFKAVQKVKHLLRAKKAGHLGTLDPMAEGVLPIALNGSTRIVQFLSGWNKEYLVELRLGIETDTQDATGMVVSKSSITNITDKDIENVTKDYIGEIEQTPPMYSAKKQNGVPLYRLARRGIEVTRKPNKVIIQSHASFGSSSGLIFSIPSQSSTHSGGPSSPLSSHSPIGSSQFSGPQVDGYNNPSTQVIA